MTNPAPVTIVFAPPTIALVIVFLKWRRLSLRSGPVGCSLSFCSFLTSRRTIEINVFFGGPQKRLACKKTGESPPSPHRRAMLWPRGILDTAIPPPFISLILERFVRTPFFYPMHSTFTSEGKRGMVPEKSRPHQIKSCFFSGSSLSYLLVTTFFGGRSVSIDRIAQKALLLPSFPLRSSSPVRGTSTAPTSGCSCAPGAPIVPPSSSTSVCGVKPLRRIRCAALPPPPEDTPYGIVWDRKRPPPSLPPPGRVC